jgi:hypothetical protein
MIVCSKVCIDDYLLFEWGCLQRVGADDRRRCSEWRGGNSNQDTFLNPCRRWFEKKFSWGPRGKDGKRRIAGATHDESLPLLLLCSNAGMIQALFIHFKVNQYPTDCVAIEPVDAFVAAP